MKTVILAGGMGTRLSEETALVPKPLVEIGGYRPLIWHIMRSYSFYGFNDFVICLGYLGNVIKQYFEQYRLRYADVAEFDLASGVRSCRGPVEPWRVALVETGLAAGTAERIASVADTLGDTFMCTYGDGLADIDIKALVDFHHEHGRLATMSVYQPESKLGEVSIGKDGAIESFREKPRGNGWINCGFFVMNREALPYLKLDPYLESTPLEALARDHQLTAYKHQGYWQCCDTLKEKTALDELWKSGNAPWAVWESGKADHGEAD